MPEDVDAALQQVDWSDLLAEPARVQRAIEVLAAAGGGSRLRMAIAAAEDGRHHDIGAALLPFTIDNARRLRFYASHWHGVDLDGIRGVADLSRLPIVTKELYRAHYMTEFDHTASHFISHSTGTTGELTYRHRSRLEAAAIRRLFSPAQVSSGVRVGISLTSSFHGMLLPVPNSGVWIPAGTRTADELRQCVDLLQTTFHVHGETPRASFLAGLVFDVAVVAQALRVSGVEPESLSLSAVTVIGPVDEGLRRFLRESFGTALHERFSSSEIFGGASRVPGPDYFVTDPQVIAEVVDENGLSLGDGAIGMLAMTELYPFVQIQPLIRYVTGDIVEKVGALAPGQLAFRWLGRVHQCATLKQSDGKEAVTFSYRPLADALGLMPAVARPCVRPPLGPIDFSDVGLPLVALSATGSFEILVQVELSFDPHFYPDHAQEVVDCVWHTVRGMARGRDDVRVRVRLCGHRRRNALEVCENANGGSTLSVGPVRLADAAPAVMVAAGRQRFDA
jgi:hypothetical protein